VEILASARDRAGVKPMVAALGCVVGLVLAAVGLQLVVNRLDWTLYPLVHDLRRVAFLLWAGLLVWAALASASSAVRRAGLPLGRLLDPMPWPRAAHRVWIALLALAAIAVLLPAIFRPSPRGVSLRAGQAWSSGAAEVPARTVARFAFQAAPSSQPERPLSVVLAGWTYAPVPGPYHFELTSYGDALLEIDGYALLGFGDHGARLKTPWATDRSGARRAMKHLPAGFHRVRLLYRQPDDRAHLALRWFAPYQTRPQEIPPRYLLPDGTSSGTLQWRARMLTAQRAGIVVLVSLLVVRLVGLARRLACHAAPRLARWVGQRPGGMPTRA
jgi:hypothetical protein